MKTLYVTRHGKSSREDTSLPDIERPLSPRGERDSETMGRRLAARNVALDALVSSPAKRAVRTSQLLADAMGLDPDLVRTDERIYEATVEELSSVVRGLADHLDRVMLVGHNPGFTDLADLLANVEVEDMPTCCVCGLSFAVDAWSEVIPGTGTMVLFEYPKKKHKGS